MVQYNDFGDFVGSPPPGPLGVAGTIGCIILVIIVLVVLGFIGYGIHEFVEWIGGLFSWYLYPIKYKENKHDRKKEI